MTELDSDTFSREKCGGNELKAGYMVIPLRFVVYGCNPFRHTILRNYGEQSVFSGLQLNTSPFVGHICQECRHLGVVCRKGFSLKGIPDAPVDHLKK